MLLSIIIPVFNAEKYIDRCISSVVNQSLKDIEIVLVNDGSTDSSFSLCKAWELKDKRIKLVSQINSGVSAARNLGISKSEGEYLMFLDSDDCMLPDMCKVMYNTLIEKNADMVICGIKETEGGIWAPEKSIDYTSLNKFKENFIIHLRTELLSPCWNKIFKKDLITNYFNENISFGEDLIFCLQYFKNCSSISFIKQSLIFHEKGISGSLVLKVGLERLLDIEYVHKAVIDFDDKNMNIDIHKKYLRDLSVYSRMLLLNDGISLKEKKNILCEWHRHSFLRSMPLSGISDYLSNRLLFFFLKYKFWDMANILVNKRIM